MAKSDPQLKNWFVIINPTAGNGKVGRKWSGYQAKLQQNLGVLQCAYTAYSGHATELAKQAINEGYRKLIAVGGDGTNHEVVNGIIAQQFVASDEIYYALLPIGTGNDWIKSHKIPKKIDAWIRMIKRNNTILQDVGKVVYQKEQQSCERYFANVAGMAYDGYVVRYIEGRKPWVINALFYILFILVCLIKYRLTKARVRFDQQERVDRFYTINVGICRFSGGGIQLVPHAQPSDGYLALTLAGPLSKWSILANMYRLYNGTIGQLLLVETDQVKELRVDSFEDERCWLEADGEFLGETPAVFTIKEKALRIIVP